MITIAYILKLINIFDLLMIIYDIRIFYMKIVCETNLRYPFKSNQVFDSGNMLDYFACFC
jgi:hypothetical protein